MCGQKDCYWHEECGDDCMGWCEDFTPVNEDADESYYDIVIRENAAEYEEIIMDYSDGNSL